MRTPKINFGKVIGYTMGALFVLATVGNVMVVSDNNEKQVKKEMRFKNIVADKFELSAKEFLKLEKNVEQNKSTWQGIVDSLSRVKRIKIK